MQIIAIANQKGGVAKTTTTLAIGAGLARKGYKVLFVDLDAQTNLSYVMEADATGLTGLTSLDVMEGRSSAADAIQHTRHGDIIAASPALAGADAALTQVGKEYRLKEALEVLSPLYDFILLDTPPALGILTVNALTACNGCIIPAQADIYSLQGISQLYNTLQTVKKYCNPSLNVLGILLTRFNARAIISREAAEMIAQAADQMGSRLYTARIRECTAIKEAQACREDIFTYAPHSNAAADYAALIDEILNVEE